MKMIFTSCFIIFVTSISAQSRNIKNQITITEKGFGDGSSKREIINFLNACDRVGEYYLLHKSIDSAFYYFTLTEKIHHHSADVDEEIEYLRNKILVKAGDLKLMGIGIIRDTAKAFYLHNRTSHISPQKDRLAYSNLFFNSTKDTFVVFQAKDSKQFVKVVAINPFLIYDSSTVQKLSNELISAISEYSGFHDVNFNIEMYRGSFSVSEEAISVLYGVLENIVARIKKEILGRITFNVNLESSHPNQFEIHTVSFPLLTIAVSY